MVSWPIPPLRVLFDELPVNSSLPDPPIAFSIIDPGAITRFPIFPAIFEANKLEEFFSEALKSIF